MTEKKIRPDAVTEADPKTCGGVAPILPLPACPGTCMFAGLPSLNSGATGSYTFEDLQYARWVGYEAGMLARVEIEAEQRAHELAHEAALEALGMARKYAAEKGPAWTALLGLDESDEAWAGEAA